MRTWITCLVAAQALLWGCAAEPRIDASSDERLAKSVERVRESLSPEQRKVFEDAVLVVAFDGADNILEIAENADVFESEAMELFHDKTAKEVIAEAETIREKRHIKQKRQLLSQIRDLEHKRAAADSASHALRQFKVVTSRFFYSGSVPRIDLTVTNKTDHPVSRAYFHGILATPGRAVPWVEADFMYRIPGGLEPGETASWLPALGIYDGWRRVPRDRSDMVLTVTTYRIDDAKGEAIFDSHFSDHDEQLLELLKAELLRTD